VTVNVIRAEMGQHVGAALARIKADELEADWERGADRRRRHGSEMGFRDLWFVSSTAPTG
jgi:hypothetical protein